METKIQKMQFKVKIAEIFPEQYDALKKAREAVHVIEENILELYYQSSRRQAAHDLASENRGGSNQKAGLTSTIVGHHIISETSIDIEKAPIQPQMIDSPTINSLLHGKLLNDGEKRKLLIRVGLSDILDAPVAS